MKKTIPGPLQIILIICLLSCSTKETAKNILSSEGKCFKIVELIKDNNININRELLTDTVSPFHKNGESYWNEYFFTNTILPTIPELKSLEILWKEKLLDSKPRFNIIKLRTNGIIIFPIKADSYYILGTKYHYLIYNPTKIAASYYPDKTKSKVIEQVEIREDWSYIVDNVYFDID